MTLTTCPVCGATEAPGANMTCPACGADLPAPEPEAPPAPDGPAAPEGPADAAEPRDAGGDAAELQGPAADTGQPPSDTAGAPGTPPPPPVPPPPSAPGWPAAGARPSPYDPSHPSGLSDSVRTYGMFTHLSTFLGAWVALAFVGPLVLWLIRRDEHPFLDHHGKEALNFNLSLLLYGVVGLIVAFVTFGIGLVIVVPGAIVLVVLWIVTTIQAAMKAQRGEGYRYPVTIRFIAD